MAGLDEITRVRYFDRQFLGAVDFRAEQTYERDARRRHVVGHHTWGIIVGLELVEAPIAGQTEFVDVVLQPGAAIDAFGRELVVYHPVRLDAAAFEAFQTDAHQSIWLAYSEEEAGGTRYGFAGNYTSNSIGLTHHFNSLFQIRPEIGYYRNWNTPAFDNGNRKDMWLYGFDMTLRF